MFTSIFFALFVSLSNSFIWIPVEQDEQGSSPWSEADLGKESYPKNIILFLGQPTKSHVCKEEFLNYTEPEYVRFSTVTSVKTCLKGNASDYESFSPTKHLASHSDEQNCYYCEKALQQAILDLSNFATEVQRVPSGVIAVANFSVYDINNGSQLHVETFKGQHFQYRTGIDEAMSNPLEIENEEDSESENDGLAYSFWRELHAVQIALCKRLLQTLGFIEPRLEASEDRYYISHVPKLTDLVHDMLRKFQSSHNDKGFVLIVNGGELQEHCGTQEAVNLKNALMLAMAKTDPAATLVVVTSSCPKNDSSEPFDITTKVYAQGPGSKELTNAEFLWDIPRILIKIWQKGFESTSTPADSFSIFQIPPLQNQGIDDTTNEDQNQNVVLSEQAENFNDQADTLKTEPEYQMETLHKQDAIDGILESLFKNVSQTSEPEYQMETLHKQDAIDGILERLFKNVSQTSLTAKMNNASDEMNIQQNNDAQKATTSAKENFVLERTKKEHKHKTLLTHLSGQYIEANENVPKFVAFDKNGTNNQTHNVSTRNGKINMSYNVLPLEEKERNSDKMLLNNGHNSNGTLLSSTAKPRNSIEDGNTNTDEKGAA